MLPKNYLLSGLIGVIMASAAGAQTNVAIVSASGLRLAQELSGEGQHAPAALEYRRLALGENRGPGARRIVLGGRL